MDALAAFLTSCVSEDEAAAKKAMADGDGRWRVSPGDGSWGDDMVLAVAVAPGMAIGDDMANCGPLQSAHIARHDPARALREVAAGRNLIAAYERLLGTKARHDKAVGEYDADVEREERTGEDPGPGSLGSRGMALRREADYLDAMLPIVRGLMADRATAWSDRPGYAEAIASDP